ncbi:hypothetical protein GHT07_19005 [Caenimonas koreensis DSM 17982]|uniref:HNH endonuclease n=1 Tax=Caenimonas koreensis DSM 17982 TaxID=1121255 RepID=A0A844AXU8_9BURK|nr:HNH endonuclease signature motif containing protein [Caenimonas koreensis]MRD49370.1 hypothetical protein [Caenimonas koreensis DSM 17982]
MSKDIARSPQSYENEALVVALMPPLLEQHGFAAVASKREHGMKFVDAKAADGSDVRFWLKQGWTGSRKYSAIQFGLFDEPGAAAFPNSHFIEHVEARVASAKAKGATHALLVHMLEGEVANYVALEVDDVAEAYRRQIGHWPKRARNTKTPTLWFEDSRSVPDTDAVMAVTELELPLSTICGVTASPKGTIDVKKVTAELELRMRQQAFRLRVGKRCGWCCVVSGTSVREVLDAAHLPGKDWRTDNQAEDGILIRTDLHRLLDRRLAELRDGKFWLSESLRRGDYGTFHNRSLTP